MSESAVESNEVWDEFEIFYNTSCEDSGWELFDILLFGFGFLNVFDTFVFILVFGDVLIKALNRSKSWHRDGTHPPVVSLSCYNSCL